MKSFGSSLKSALITNYARGSGRSPRSEYWFYTLFLVIAGMAAGFMDVIVNPSLVENPYPNGLFSILIGAAWPTIGFSLFTFIPNITVGVRRLHDVGRSGWWLLISLTIIGIIPLIYWCGFKRGDHGENQFGVDPYADITASDSAV